MKFNILLPLSALVATTLAEGLGDLPNCAKDCATKAIPLSCGVDFKCICEAKSFLNDVSCCVADKCAKADQDLTLKAAKAICEKAGATNLPTAATCSTGASNSTSSTSTGTQTGSATAATNSGTTTTNTATGTASSASATNTNAAAAVWKDSSMVAAAGAAAAFAFLV